MGTRDLTIGAPGRRTAPSASSAGSAIGAPDRRTAPSAPSAGPATCGHCGLAAAADDAYCCYGCELAARIAAEGAEEHGRARAVMTLSLLLSMAVMMLSLLLFAEDVYDVAPSAELAWLGHLYRAASAALATPVIVMLGYPLLRRAARAAAAGRLAMDQLIVAGAAAAYALSLRAIFAGRGGVYFDSATSALLLATLGRYLEARARAQASRVLGPSLKRSQEPVLVSRGGPFVALSPALVAPGDRLRIEVEEVLPVDAEVVGEAVDVNLGVLTGEPSPVTRAPGEPVPAGAVPVSGPMECVAVRSAQSSTLERLAHLAASLRERPARVQRFADAFAAALTPVVFVLAAVTFARFAAAGAAERGVVASLAVVLAACPCTYGVATPLVFWLALRKALEHGVLVRTAATLEQAAAITTVAFDKTGTLTARALTVLGVELTGAASRAEVLSLASALEAGSRHPLALALCALAASEGVAPAPLSALSRRELRAGRGVVGRTQDGRPVLLGSPRLLAEEGALLGDGDDAPGGVAGEDVRVLLALDGAVVARFRIGEALRPEASEALAALRAQGIGSVVLTGDGSAAARTTAALLDLPVLAGLSPTDKVAALRRLGGCVAMVGDGLNDAPALAGVGPGFAVEGGTDLARGMAQVSLLKPDLRLVAWTIGLARRAVVLARRSLIIATAYNVVFLALAAAGALRPVWAGLSMATSSLLMLASTLGFGAHPGPGEEPA